MSYHSIGEGSSSSNQLLSNRKGKEKYSPTNQQEPFYTDNEQQQQKPLLAASPSSDYGAIIPATASSSSSQHEPATATSSIRNRRSQKTCTYIAISITTCSAVFLFCLLWFAPTFAERSVKDGVGFSFQKASILNVTEDNVITMHVIGKIELQPKLFSLQRKFNNMFGTIGIQQSALQVHYEPKESLLLSSMAMGTIDLPALDLNSASSVTNFNFITRFMIDDTDALMDFCKDAVVAKTIMWRVAGPLSVTLGWLPWKSNVDLDKTIELEGMDGLKKTDLQSLMFPGPHPLGGVAVYATVGIYNPSSVLSLSLGDMDFGIFLPAASPDDKDAQMAVVQAVDADLQGHRMNYFNVTGRTLPIPQDEKSQALMESFLTGYLHGNTSWVHVRGSSFGPDDQPHKKHVSTTPRWLRKALESVVLSVPFPGATETDLIQSLALSHIKIDFSSTGNPLISGDAIALLKKPQEMQFHMDVTEIDPTVYLYLNVDSTKPFAVVKPNRPCPASTEEGNGIDLPLGTMKVTSRLYRAPFKVLPGGQKDFEEFLNRVFHEKKGKVYIHGTSDAKVDSAFGNLNIRDLEFNGEIETQGLQGMQHPPPQVTDMTIVQGHSDALHASTVIRIYSPADVHINLGQLNMLLLFNDHVIGNTTIPELALAPGVFNELTVSAWLFGNNRHVIDFIGQFISNGITAASNVTLTISGNHPNPTRSKFLENFLRNLSFDVQPPPFDKEPLLADCQVNILSSTVVMSMRNPFPGVEMAINKINASATYEIYEIGRMVADFEDKGEGWKGPLILPPPKCNLEDCEGVVVESEKIPVMTKKLGFEAIKKALGGSIEVSVDSQVAVMIDQFELRNLEYRQSNITAKVRKGF
ncbi:hypothetical protein HMPREF1544_05582 [Mucor circinelloides 1006PhL]|uniref:Uncharacterized protein n=1 Tax=Mucor circinelloides f. circinelloides (strain 1006PhL) TaxID=1220926 RepID=S2K5V5_MUCC1|nr:hypothetical protein HMPREF1544_05582 [Mucor circinelloides 1006PhL]